MASAEQKVPTVAKADERWDVFYKLMPQAVENLKGDMAELEVFLPSRTLTLNLNLNPKP